MTDTRIPRVALILGLAGLIPFVVSAVFCLSADPAIADVAAKSLAAYAAVILSFLGGVRWGALLTDGERFQSYCPAIVSVLPSILAWVSLLLPLLLSTGPMLSLLLVGLLLQYLIDSPYAPVATTSHLPGWYARLRLLLSTGAVLSVGLGLYASYSVVN